MILCYYDSTVIQDSIVESKSKTPIKTESAKSTKPSKNQMVELGEAKKEALYQALLTLNTVEECALFFKDLCTPSEIDAMKDRFKVALLLDSQSLSYRDIYEKTKVSLATIGRVARFLSQENNQGYRLVIDRLRHSNQIKDDRNDV